VIVSVATIAGGISNANAATIDVTVNAGAGSNPSCADDDSCLTPTDATVAVGDTVRWANAGTFAYTITSGTLAGGPDGIFDSSLIFSSSTFNHTFDTVGVFPYFDLVHPWIQGQVSVSQVVPEPGSAMLLVVAGGLALLRPRKA